MVDAFPILPETTLDFSCLLESAEDFFAEDYDLHHGDGCVYFSVPFAISDDKRWQTMIDVGYREHTAKKPAEGSRPCDFCEFTYEISLVDTYGEFQVTSTMDRNVAAKWLPPGSGPLVLEIISLCYRYFILAFEPGIIYRVTNVSGQPDEALERYRVLTQFIESQGYTLF